MISFSLCACLPVCVPHKFWVVELLFQELFFKGQIAERSPSLNRELQ